MVPPVEAIQPTSGQLAPGAELPSVRELAVAHAVNPMTVSKAYSLLEAEGLLQRNRGRRMKQLEPVARQLVLSARQLELERKGIDAVIDRAWESSHDE